MLNNSVGNKLRQARINKQLSVEEASRVTRIRPDKLLDLEEDNYANFPSMSYAKGFLQLYARFLGVDIREYTDSIQTPNPVSTDDYEYLNAAASNPPPPPTRRPYHFSAKRERTILPVIVFGFLIMVVVLGIYLFVTFQRLGPLDELSDKKDTSSPSSSPAISTLPAPDQAVTPLPIISTPIPIAAATPLNPTTLPPALAEETPVHPQPLPIRTPQPAPQTLAAGNIPAPPMPAPTFDPNREVRRAEPVFPTSPTPAPAPSASLPSPVGSGPALASTEPASTPDSAATPEPVKQVSIRPLRKTWVTIRRDVADSAPFFEDWLYPGDGPLKMSGHKFWIQVDDPSAVEITQDGQPLPASTNEIQIE